MAYLRLINKKESVLSFLFQLRSIMFAVKITREQETLLRLTLMYKVMK